MAPIVEILKGIATASCRCVSMDPTRCCKGAFAEPPRSAPPLQLIRTPACCPWSIRCSTVHPVMGQTPAPSGGKYGGQVRSDTTSPSGRMIMTVFAGIAEFERTLILSRTQEGRLAAQARGVAFGRPKKMPPDQQQLARDLVRDGKSISAVAGLSTSTQPPSIASSTDSSLMLLFCSAQLHKPCWSRKPRSSPRR